MRSLRGVVCLISPTIPKKVYEKIANWKFVDLAELKPAGTLDTINPDPDPQK